MGGNGSGRKTKVEYEVLRKFKAQGHTMKEVAERFGVSQGHAQFVCKGISPQRDRPQEYRNAYSGIDKDAIGRKLVDERAPDFDYVGGYTNSDGFVDIQCKSCGVVLHKSCVTIRHRKTVCDNCNRLAAEKSAEQKEKQRKIEADKKKWAKAGKRKAQQLSFSVCECCGCLFMPIGNRNKYCSVECGEKAHYSVKKDRRLKKLSTVIIDRSITLERLFEKSNGECALCGGKCNWADHFIKDNGAFVAGATYPTIDHIRPISKGGLHEWKNVQLAHFSCNSKKSDTLCPLVRN